MSNDKSAASAALDNWLVPIEEKLKQHPGKLYTIERDTLTGLIYGCRFLEAKNAELNGMVRQAVASGQKAMDLAETLSLERNAAVQALADGIEKEIAPVIEKADLNAQRELVTAMGLCIRFADGEEIEDKEQELVQSYRERIPLREALLKERQG